MVKKKTYAQLARDLAANQSLLADAVRQRNEALAGVKDKNERLAKVEGEARIWKQRHDNVLAQTGYMLEPMAMLLQQAGRGGV